MLPKPTVAEGSRKVLNGKEVYTRRNYTTDRGNFFETMIGEFILPNGEPIEDVSILESLPEPQRQKALAWWDRRFGGVVEKEEVPPAGRKMTKAELLAKARFLMEQAEMMEDEEAPAGSDKPDVADLMAENEILKTQIAAMSTDSPSNQKPFEPEKELKGKETKRPVGKSKGDGGTDVLKQMGIQG